MCVCVCARNHISCAATQCVCVLTTIASSLPPLSVYVDVCVCVSVCVQDCCVCVCVPLQP